MALDIAMQDLRHRRGQLSNSFQLEYQRRISNQNDSFVDYQVIEQYHKKQNTLESEQLSNIEVKRQGDLKNTEGISFQFDILFNLPLELIEKAKFVEETELEWVFDIPTPIGVSGDDVEQGAINSANASLQSALSTRLMVSKSTMRFSAMHIFAPKPFKPNLLTRVDVFSIDMTFNTIDKDGPLFVTQQRRHMKGRYSFMINIEQVVTVTLSDVNILPR